MNKEKIINIAVIAHVDAGKSTLVDAFLAQSGVFRENEEMKDCVMDSDDIERERGITIYSKNCSVMHGDYKINIVDTPGHADFSSEVERIIKTVDTVILLVDSSEGPMPQTRFVLSKALEQDLNPILLINKIDKKDARIDEVVDEVYELFMDLDANDRQLDFPILYGIARQGIVVRDPKEAAGLNVEGTDGTKIKKSAAGQGGLSITPLFETIIEQCGSYPDLDDEPLQMQISTLGYDDYVGRLGIGRIDKGVLRAGTQVAVAKPDGSYVMRKINQCFVYRGMKRVAVQEVHSGDICVVCGIADITIGDTLCNEDHIIGLPAISIEDPTLSMNFIVNKSPFAGKEGKYVTSRHIRERLAKELEVNVGLKVEETETTDSFKVSGRGELHLAGGIISDLNLRKGIMVSMDARNGRSRLVYTAPTRGLMGYRSQFINQTRGEGIMVRPFSGYEDYKGDIPQRMAGAIIAQEPGVTTPYAINNLQERMQFFIGPGVKVYEGMIVGQNSRNEDMVVNPCKAKHISNMRAAGSDDNVKLTPPRIMSLEEALEWINDDELVEVTPVDIRLRKKILGELERRRSGRN